MIEPIGLVKRLGRRADERRESASCRVPRCRDRTAPFELFGPVQPGATSRPLLPRRTR